MIINEVKVEKAKQLVKSADKPVVILSQDDAFNRKMLEYGKFDFLMDVEQGERKDKLKQLDSGFNHVLAGIAAKNKISLSINLDKIRSKNKKEKAIILSRIIQNIKINRKDGVKIKAMNFKDSRDTLSFMQTLGSSSKGAKRSNIFLTLSSL